jgi:hypothetical protein
MVRIAERGHADGLALELLDGGDGARGLRCRDDGEQRQPSGDREAADVGADIC